ncbi:MAG: hypothetical protein ACOYM4_18710, partial [Nodosilinea sp.]
MNSAPNKSLSRRRKVDLPHPESPATPIRTTLPGLLIIKFPLNNFYKIESSAAKQQESRHTLDRD